MVLVVHKLECGSEARVLPLAVLLPPGRHHQAQQHPADAEAQVPGQVHRVEDEDGPAEVHEHLHEDAVDRGGAQLLLPEPRCLRRARAARLRGSAGRCHRVGLPLGGGVGDSALEVPSSESEKFPTVAQDRLEFVLFQRSLSLSLGVCVSGKTIRGSRENFRVRNPAEHR